MAEQTKALTAQQQKAKNVQAYLMARAGGFKALLPKHLTPERMVRGLMAAASRNPTILECTLESVLNAMLVCSSFGLEPGRPRGGMHLVPFRNSKRGGAYELTPIPDYRGLMDLAFRSGLVEGIEARSVFSKDEYDYAYGTESFIKHKPTLAPDRGELVSVYAVAHLKGLRRPVFVWLSMTDVNAARARSRAKESGPWVTDFEAMALKTAVRRLANWIPQASELQTAVEMESRVEAGEGIGDLFEGVIDLEAEDVTGKEKPALTGTGAVLDALASGKGNGGAASDAPKAPPFPDPGPTPGTNAVPAEGEHVPPHPMGPEPTVDTGKPRGRPPKAAKGTAPQAAALGGDGCNTVDNHHHARRRALYLRDDCHHPGDAHAGGGGARRGGQPHHQHHHLHGGRRWPVRRRDSPRRAALLTLGVERCALHLLGAHPARRALDPRCHRGQRGQQEGVPLHGQRRPHHAMRVQGRQSRGPPHARR